jgi:hypothetical protein
VRDKADQALLLIGFCFLIFRAFLFTRSSYAKGFHCDIFIHAYIPSPLSFPFVLFPPSENNFNSFHCSLFICVYKVIQ